MESGADVIERDVRCLQDDDRVVEEIGDLIGDLRAVLIVQGSSHGAGDAEAPPALGRMNGSSHRRVRLITGEPGGTVSSKTFEV